MTHDSSALSFSAPISPHGVFSPRGETSSLLARLPSVRGSLREQVSMAEITWFRVGGAAEVLFKPADRADLQDFLRACPAEVPVVTIGVGSNLLVRDGGIAGVVIRLGRGFTEIVADPVARTLRVGAASLDSSVAHVAQEAGIGGLEFLSGIPGTLGGGIRTNAGCFGGELKDVLVELTAIDRQGAVHVLTPDEMKLSYRHCGLPEDWIFVEALLQGRESTPEAVATRIEEIRQKRGESSQGAVLRARTSGSLFGNPGGPNGRGTDPLTGRAWELVDAAGCRGRRKGGAAISESHANFLINTGDATAADLEDLGEEVRRLVKEKTGADLRWEIQRIGRRKEEGLG